MDPQINYFPDHIGLNRHVHSFNPPPNEVEGVGFRALRMSSSRLYTCPFVSIFVSGAYLGEISFICMIWYTHIPRSNS